MAAPQRKEGVDKTTKEYWRSYFGPYGKTWTDEVPRRVAAFIADSITKSAAKTDNKAVARVLKARITGLGPSSSPSWTKTATGGLLFEGLFRGTVVRGDGSQGQILRGFAAEFDPTGNLLNCKTISI